MNETILEIVRANVREPIQVEGDLYSLTACNDIGCRRLIEMMEEFDLDTLSGAVSAGTVEIRLFRAAVDGNEILVEKQFGVVFFDVLHERRNVVRNAEQSRSRVVKLDFDVLQTIVTAPVVARQVHRLLRCASAVDGHGRLREYRATAL